VAGAHRARVIATELGDPLLSAALDALSEIAGVSPAADIPPQFPPPTK